MDQEGQGNSQALQTGPKQKGLITHKRNLIMLLFLPDGVLSVSAHKSQAAYLKLRALDRKMITNHFLADVYYDGKQDFPYHATIWRAQLQKFMFGLLAELSYTQLLEITDGRHYETLLKQVHRAVNFYPDYEIRNNPLPNEPEFGEPGSVELFAGMVLDSTAPRQHK